MEFHSEHQSNFDFNFPETQSFHPEYLPELVTPYFINKSPIAEYSKKSFFRRFLSLPKMTAFVLDSLEKNNEFSLDLHNSFQQTGRNVSDLKTKVEKLNEKFLALEGVHGDFRPLLNKLASSENIINEKLRKVENTNNEITGLKLQISSLRNQNRLLWPVIILSVILNLITSYYFFLM